MKEKATYGNQHTGKMRWGRAVVCAVAGCLAFGLSADVGTEARIPIVGWAGLSQDKASAERYAEAKDAGFTHLTQWCETPSDAGRLLAEAEKAGMKLIIGFGGRDIKRMTDEAEAFTAAAKGSPALEYYFIADEPHIGRAGDIRDCIARYEALDPAHPCYVNLLGAGWVGDLSKAATVTFTPPEGSGLEATTWNKTGNGAGAFTFNARGVWTVALTFADNTTRTAQIDIQTAGFVLVVK